MIRKFCDICGMEVDDTGEHMEVLVNFAMFNAMGAQEHSDFLDKIDICKKCKSNIIKDFVEVDLHREIVQGLKIQHGFLVDEKKNK